MNRTNILIFYLFIICEIYIQFTFLQIINIYFFNITQVNTIVILSKK